MCNVKRINIGFYNDGAVGGLKRLLRMLTFHLDYFRSAAPLSVFFRIPPLFTFVILYLYSVISYISVFRYRYLKSVVRGKSLIVNGSY